MAGYRDEPRIFGDEPQETGMHWSMKALITIVCMVVYGVPLFYLWNACGYPDGLGVRITAHGRAGGIETWWYSYLLVERHRPLDLLTFIYMWTPIAGYLGWLAFKQLKSVKFSLYSDPVE